MDLLVKNIATDALMKCWRHALEANNSSIIYEA